MSSATLAADDSAAGTLRVALAGDWLLGHGLPGADPVLDRLRQAPKPASVAFDTGALGDWDTGLVTTLIHIHKSAEANSVQVDASGLPEGARKLIDLAFAVKEREGARRSEECKSLLQQVGEGTLEVPGRRPRAAGLYRRAGAVRAAVTCGVKRPTCAPTYSCTSRRPALTRSRSSA